MVAQLRDHKEDFDQRNARVVSVGMGTPAMAAHFKSGRELPFTLLVDEERETYKALAIGKGSTLDLVDPRVWKRALKSLVAGNIQVGIQGNPYQLGGVAIAKIGGEIAYLHRSILASTILPSRNCLRRSIN